MKRLTKILKTSAAFVLVIGLVFGGLSLNLAKNQRIKASAYSVPTPFAGDLIKRPSGTPSYLGDGSSRVVNNPTGLGTTTLFSGTSVTANGTVASDKSLNFNIYGNDKESPTSVLASRQEYYLIPNSTEFIDTLITPDGDTKLEIFFMIPEGTTVSDFSAAQHPDVVGCNASDGSNHFGGPLLMKTTNKIQFLYGVWSDGDDTLTAKNNSGIGADNSYINWTAGNQYHSIIDAQNGGATISLETGNLKYENVIDNSEATKYNAAATANYNTLYMFGQNNNGSCVNPVKIGIKEVIISKASTKEIKGHFFAVPQGSTEFSTTPAPSNCMYDTASNSYFTSKNAGTFKVVPDNNTNEINITAVTDGGLSGNKLAKTSTHYTYIDGNGDKWASDYLEVNQEENKVVLHKLISTVGAGENRITELAYSSSLQYDDGITSGDTNFDDKAIELLEMKTTDLMTGLSNDKDAWMDGIIGPIVKYMLEPGNCDPSDIEIDEVLFSILTLSENVKATTETAPSASYTAAIWRVEDGHNLGFCTSKVDNSPEFATTISAKDILFSYDQVLQKAKPVSGENYYSLEVNVEFDESPVTTITITADTGVDIKIGGKAISSDTVIVPQMPTTIEGFFNEILFELDVAGSTLPGTLNGNSVSFTPSGTAVNIVYKIKAKDYSVRILGKTTKNHEIDLGDEITDGYEEIISYKETNLDKIIIADLDYANEYFNYGGTVFGNNFLYVFDHFEVNGQAMELTDCFEIDMFALINNPRIKEDEIFTVYAVYQKKFVVTLGFEFGGNADDGSKYESPSFSVLNKFDGSKYNGISNEIQGYLINEDDTAVILLKPDIRYAVASVSGDGGTSQISSDYPELLVITFDQSYNIIVTLKNREIKVNYDLNITDNNEREIFGVAQYISNNGVTNMSYTMVSVENGAQTLMANQEMLNTFKYRSNGFGIYNFLRDDGTYDAFNGILNASNADFFEKYVDKNGNSRVCLFVVQQYIVDFSTPGFTQNGTTFTGTGLGSYTIDFNQGEYTSLGSGKYMVDYGTEITLQKTVGKYGKFVHFTGLNDEENEVSAFVVYGDRYVGVNFESTKLAPWVMPTILGGSGLLLIFALLTVFLVMRSAKHKKQKLAREAEIRDMKRRFNISDEISKLRDGNLQNIPQAEIIKPGAKKNKE